jgi:hypothetical protein
MIYHAQNRNRRSKIGRFCILIFFLLAICYVSRASQEPAFVLSGNFEDVFADKHDLSGSFTARAFESNALIDMTFENGFREVVGTDGHDTFTYYPFSDDRTIITNANGIAYISYGRFPKDAHFVQQVLWLVCVHDPELNTNLPSIRFPFYGIFSTNDIVPRVITNSTPPNFITSIKWYAPNYILLGTNRYRSSLYTNGWLLAELAVTKTQPIGNAPIPTEVRFTQYKTRFYTNINQFREVPTRNPDDVLPVEHAILSITNIQADNPLSSYIPEILDKTARINDTRIGMGVIKVASGKWWTARELHKSREAPGKPHREMILILLIIVSLFSIILLIGMAIVRRNKIIGK